MRGRFLFIAVSCSFAAMCCAPAGASAATAARTATAVPAGSAAATGGAQLVQSAGASQTGAAKSLTAAFPAPTGAGNLLVLSASVYTGTSNRITSVTDSAGGAWTRIGAYAISGHNSLSLAGLPAGAVASFSPATVSAGQSSTLAISASVSTPAATSALRGAFYYPWFPDTWVQQGQNPFTNYSPARGLYSTDAATVAAQVADMQYGGITVGIASWFGQGTITDKHWPALLQAARGTAFAWAPYYEPEGVTDPAPQKIANDLHYIRSTYGGAGSALASLPGKGMPVFVYNADDPTAAKGCDTVDRWNEARQLLQQQFGESVYVDLKVFPGYATCAGTPGIDGWHQYGPASADQNLAHAPGAGSYAISPGYWKSGVAYGTAPFLARDRARWQASIASMNASGAKWQLITTYNEWGEGTAIENSTGCRNPAPAGTYCDWSGGGTGSDFVADLHSAPPG
jgi:hypothetical protein